MFNVTLVEPDGYVHAQALAEAVEYLAVMLEACGQTVRRTRNHIERGAHNVVLCSHLLGDAHIAQLPADTILFNSEPLAEASPAYLAALARFWVWDYAYGNLPRIPHARVAVISFLFAAALVRSNAREPGDALLFYGSLTERRRAILADVRARGVPIEVVFGEYGPERDRRMFRCRAVLNLHKAKEPSVFEPIRCFYPLINGVPVISEHVAGEPIADAFRPSVAFCSEEMLVDDIVRWWGAPADLAARAAQFASTTALPEIERAVAAYLAR